MKKSNLIIAAILALVLTVSCFAGCAVPAPAVAQTALSAGGVLNLKVNPEIAIAYDENGLVTSVTSLNEDGRKILQSYSGFEGKECREVVNQLVVAIGNAGYFADDVDGGPRQITIEIERGSKLPTATFLDDVVAEVEKLANSGEWNNSVYLAGLTDYGITDYGRAYNNGNAQPAQSGEPAQTGEPAKNAEPAQGVEAAQSAEPAQSAETARNEAATPVYGRTDYRDTDYGPNNDGVTDYGRTDYGRTNYGNTNYGRSDYGRSDYGRSDYGNSDYRR